MHVLHPLGDTKLVGSQGLWRTEVEFKISQNAGETARREKEEIQPLKV